ncbi:HesA/MoeB/ThiF family protein [Sphingorhabdus lacus]|jgi:molybdopterin/thiamine biosynthesis adenylyltransferase|uniref:Molybdopterin-synthase adenylyltransferase n=1 Tax=Sphingorhabdus lacus TaxID=392610 RepID=A0A6I6LA12_9SPHN|nr:HesA/MoeB/ThiF family protein [Sphingorhabdus lacus]QGY79372.1 HesA/MoeB/ThiF family protein [Sphingorhabdus lacus]
MAELSDHQLDRYARHIVLRDIGGAGQARLLESHVLLIGAGGIGSPAIQYLAAAGVGTISVVDDDAISLSNLQRQILYSETQIGEAKVEAAAAAVKRLNPDVSFHAIRRRIHHLTTSDILNGVDVVIDGSDNFATRLTVNDLCLSARVPLVSAAIGQFHGQIGTFTGWQNDAPCYRCFVGDAHDPDDCDDCATQGVLGAMCGLMGSFAAMEAIRVLTGFGDSQSGKLHIFDGMTPSMRSIKLPKDPACSSCGSLSS